MLGGDETSYGARLPKGKTWKQIFIDEVRDKISDQGWTRVHYLGRVPYDRFLSMMQVSRVHIYLTYPFVLSWSLLEAMSGRRHCCERYTARERGDGGWRNGVVCRFL